MKIPPFFRSASSIMIWEAALIAIVSFGTFTVLMRMVTIETFGLWALLTSFLNFARVADFWSRGLLSFIGENRGAGRESDAKSFVSTTVVIGTFGNILLAAVAGGVIYIFAGKISPEVSAAEIRAVIPIMLLTFCVMSTSTIYLTAFIGFGKPLFRMIQTVGGALLLFVCSIYLVQDWGLKGLLFAQLIQATAALILGVVLFHWVVTPKIKAPLWKTDQSRDLVSFGSKATVVMSVQLAIEPIIRGLSNAFGGLAAVAAVDIASRLIASVRALVGAPSQMLIPIFARQEESETAFKEIKHFYFEMNRLFLILAILAFSALVSAGPILEEIIFGNSNTGFLSSLIILSVAWGTNIATVSSYSLLVGKRQLKPLFVVHLIMAIGALLLGTVGGSLVGILGALAGVCLAFTLSSIYVVHAARPYINASTIFRLPILTLAPLALAITSTVVIQSVDWSTWGLLARFALYACAIGLTLGLCIRYCQIKDLGGMLSTIKP